MCHQQSPTCIEEEPGAVSASLDGGLHEGGEAQPVGLVGPDPLEVLQHQTHHVRVACNTQRARTWEKIGAWKRKVELLETSMYRSNQLPGKGATKFALQYWIGCAKWDNHSKFFLRLILRLGMQSLITNIKLHNTMTRLQNKHSKWRVTTFLAIFQDVSGILRLSLRLLE